jgi:hypothetical protein
LPYGVRLDFLAEDSKANPLKKRGFSCFSSLAGDKENEKEEQ